MINAHPTPYSPAGNCFVYVPGITTLRAGTTTNTKEAGLGPNQYEANLTDFYNKAQDPDNLNKLARQYNQYQGIVDENAATNAIERIANEAGYKGITNTGGAISFVPQELKRKK
jgi:hypothetical protein